MSKKSIRAVIWDLDGTLIHFKINSIKARMEAIRILKKFEIPKTILSIKQSIIENVEIAKKYMNPREFPEDKIARILKEVNDAVIKVEHDAAIKATLIDGIDEVLEYLKQKNVKQAIFTYNTHNNAQISLQSANIDQYFEVIAGRDDVKTLKPHPDHLKFICDRLGVSFDEIIVIGDTGRDIEAALNVGSPSIALNTKIPLFLKRETFNQAEKVIEPEEIPTVLIKILEDFL
ncbi:MAG: HAD family hydrolase [Promethearchaeota archaeon]|jgi:HAD superfamily hydrolase (TIGR01549 family)